MTPQEQHDDTQRGPAAPAPEQLRARAIAQGRREGRRRRTRSIRRSIWGTTAALFVAAFLGVYVQLASGNDPALNAAAKRESAKALTASSGSSSSSKATAAASEEARRSETQGRRRESRRGETQSAGKRSRGTRKRRSEQLESVERHRRHERERRILEQRERQRIERSLERRILRLLQRRKRIELAVLRRHLPVMSAGEAIERFPCFGGSCGVIVSGDAPGRSAAAAVARAREQLLEWHEGFSRFLPESELSRLNEDPRERVPVSPLMAYLASTRTLRGGAERRARRRHPARRAARGGLRARSARAAAAAARARARPRAQAGDGIARAALARAARRPARGGRDPPARAPAGQWRAREGPVRRCARREPRRARVLRRRLRRRPRDRRHGGPAPPRRGPEPVRRQRAARLRARGGGYRHERASAAAHGSAPTGARPTTCSTRRRACRPSRVWSRRPRSRPPPCSPRSTRRPRC